MNWMVLVPGVSSMERPLARRANSFEHPSSHLGFASVCKRCRYSRRRPVDSSNTALAAGKRGDFSGRTGRGLMVLEGGRGRVVRLEEGVVAEGVNRRAVKGVRGGDGLSLGGGDGSTLGGGKGPTGRGEEGSTLGGGHLKIVFKYNKSL